jgi:hypothetical protein
MRLDRCLRLARPVAMWLAVCAATSARAAPSAWAQAERPAVEHASSGWHSIPLPVTIDQLATAAALPMPAAPEFFLFDLIRVVHERPFDEPRAPTGPLADVLSTLRESGANAVTLVPLPLAPEIWSRVVFGRPVTPKGLAAAILEDRRASLLYVGLGALDSETLAALERDPGLLATIAGQHAAVLAAFGRSVSIRDGRVRLPPPEDSRVAWEALVGAPASDPGRFLPALLGRDRGRLAYFFDAVMQLDEPHRRFVLGPNASALLAAYEPVRTSSREWIADVHPFYRPPFDLVKALRATRVTDDGRVRPPASRLVWERVFAGRRVLVGASSQIPARDEVDAPWLLSQWLGSNYRDAAVQLDQLRLAQRVFAGSVPSDAGALERAIVAVARYPSLTLTLERLGVTGPATYAAAADVAAAVSSRATRRDGFAALSLFQGMFAFIERAAWAGTFDQPRAQQLAASLLEQRPSPGGDYEAALIEWLSKTLLPAFGAITDVAPASRPERVVLAALAGVKREARRGTPVLIEWEGEPYRLDVAAGTLARLQRFRTLVVTPSLEQALALHQAVGDLQRPGASPGVASLSSLLDGLEEVVPVERDEGEIRVSLERARRALSRVRSGPSDSRPSAGALRDLVRLRNVVFADVVRALAYLPSLGDPEGPARLGGDVARRHRFDALESSSAADPAWNLPREVVTADRGWHVRGSLLGLDVALARLALRRLDVDRIPLDPRLDDAARRGFAVAAALARPTDVTDDARDRLATALARGRSRVDAAARMTGGLATVASAAGLDARRAHALQWAVEVLSVDPVTRLSLGEIGRLGADEPLPFELSTVPDTSCLAGVTACGATVSDLAIHLLDGLAARRLPAALLPGLLTSATQDLLDDTQSIHPDDTPAIWQTVREIRRERIDDYVAALAGAGPLVPVEAKQTTGDRR